MVIFPTETAFIVYLPFRHQKNGQKSFVIQKVSVTLWSVSGRWWGVMLEGLTPLGGYHIANSLMFNE